MKISSSIFVVACLLNVGLVLGYQPWAENLDKPEDQWKILKFYPHYLRNTKLNDDGRVINEFDVDVTSEYVEVAKHAIESGRVFYQTYSPEKDKEESALLYEIVEGDEEFKDLWEYTTPDPVLYTSPAPGSEPKLAKGITIEDIIQQVLLFDINGKPQPKSFAENPLGLITTSTEMETEPAIESSTVKKVTSEPSFETTVVKNFVEMTRAPVQLVDDKVNKETVESDAESEHSDKPVEALSLHEVLSMNLTGPNDDESDLFKVHEEIDPGNETAGSLDIKVHDDEMEAYNVTFSSLDTKVHEEMEPEIGTSRSMEVEVQDEMETDNVTSRSLDIKVDDEMGTDNETSSATVIKIHEARIPNVVYPGTKAYDQYFYKKVDDHEDGNISWEELVATLSLNRSDLVPLVVRNKRQAKDLNAPLTDFYPTSNPKFADLTREEIEREFDLGRITLEEYAKDFVAYIDSTLPSSKLNEDVVHGPSVPDVSSTSTTTESKVLDQDKNLATSVEITHEPTFKSTEINNEPSSVPMESFVAVEEVVPTVSSAVPSVLKTADKDLVQEDIDEAFEQGKITFEDYKGHFKNYIENKVPAIKTTENSVPSIVAVESVAVIEEKEPTKSLDVSSNSKAAVDNMKENVFEEDKVSNEEHSNNFLAFVEEKEEPTFKTTADFKIGSPTSAVVDEEPMPTESVLKAVVDNVSEDVDEAYKQDVKESPDQFVTSVDKQAQAFKRTEDSEFSSVPVETIIVEDELNKPTDDSTNAKAAVEIVEDEDVDKAFEEGRISISEYNDHFVNFVQNKFPASKITDDFEPTIAPLESFSVVEEELTKSSDVSSPSKAPVGIVEEEDVDKAFEEGRISIIDYNDHFVNFVQNKFPASKITDDFEPTIAPLESFSVVEEELTKSSDVSSPSKAPVGIVEEEDVDKAFEEGRISIIDYNDHFVNFVQNKFPASKTTKKNFESFDPHVENHSVLEEEESVPTESSVSSNVKTKVYNINTEEDVGKAFEQGKINTEEYADHFVAFVEKNIPASKITEDAELHRGFETESLPSKLSESSNHQESVVGLEEQGIAKELEESKVSPKEFIYQLLSMKKSIISSKSTSDVVSSNRGRQNVDGESDLSFVPNKSSSKMSMEEMMSSLGLTKKDLHEILANVQPLWKGNFTPKSRSNSKITRPQKISTTEAPIISTTPVPQRKVPTSVSPATKVDADIGRDFVKDFMEGKISKSEYINMLIKSSKTPLIKPITKPTPSPKTPKKTAPTSKTSAPRPIQSKKVVQPSAISKPTPVSNYAKNPLFAVLGKNSPPVPFVPTSPSKDLVSPLNTKLTTALTTKSRFNVYDKVPARFGAVVDSVFPKYDSPLYAVHKKAPTSKAVGKETTPVRKQSPLYAVFEKAPTSTHAKSTPSSKGKVSGSAGNPLYAVFEKAPTSTRVKSTSFTKNTKSAHSNPLYAVFEKAPTSTRVKSTSFTKNTKSAHPNPLYAVFEKSPTSTSVKSTSFTKGTKLAHPNPLYAVFEKSPTSTSVKSTSYTKNTKSAHPNPLYAVFEHPTSSKKSSSVVNSKPKQTWVTVPEDEFKHLTKAPVSNLLDVVYTGAKPVFRNVAKPVPFKSEAEVSTKQPVVTYTNPNTLPRSFLSILGTDAKKPKYEIHYHNYNVKLPHHVATPFIHKLFHGLHSKTKTEEEDPEEAVREISKVFQRIE